jgi:CheY-like chemotaxis protein
VKALLSVVAFSLAIAGTLLIGEPARGQEEKKGPAIPREIYQQFRGHLTEGKYDIAALFLKAFLESGPTDQDLLDIEAKYGSTAFSQLRTIRKWSDDPKVDQQAKSNVETLNKKLRDATEKLLSDPGRIAKFVRNLGESYEEKEFAIVELKRMGNYPIPAMAETLKANNNPAVTNGILEAIPRLNFETMAGWLAALDGLAPDQQYVVLARILGRDDVLTLLTKAQTDFRPVLWHFAGSSASPPLKKYAADVLEKLVGGATKKTPEGELVAAAKVFSDRKAIYMNPADPRDMTPATVPVWTWNAATNKLELKDGVTVGQADEYFGLRYARWALEKSPDYEPAQAMVLTIAAERAMDRGKFGELARTDPVVYRMLADAPASVLADLLARSLVEKRTGLALALAQSIGDRAETNTKLLAQALDYGDPRVQLAAANALLRSPTPVDEKVRGKIVEILRRAAGADPNALPNAKGQALIADPNKQRADDAAILLRGLGYETEVYTNGRDLLRRARRASDYDLILIDHHLPNPQIDDVVANLRADARAARRPLLIVASTDTVTPPSLDQLLLRFALLIAATETDPLGMPDPFVPDVRKTDEEQAPLRRTIQDRRDDVFRTAMESRIDRLQRVLETTGLELNSDQRFQVKLRVEQVTAAVLAAEYPLSAESAPRSYKNYLTLMKQIAMQPDVPAYKRRVGVDHIMKLIERLETDVRNDKASNAKYEALRSRVDPESLGLRVEPTRDLESEARLARQFRADAALRVIPEPVSRFGLELDINAAFQDPADRPRDPAEKKASARLAVGWLAKMASGEIRGFEVKTAAGELIAALRTDDTADAAIDGVARFPTAEAQQGLLSTALTGGRSVGIRTRAADAAIRHIQVNGKLAAKPLVDGVVDFAGKETDADLRAKLLVLKGLLAPNPAGYVGELRGYSPPLVPAAPVMPPAPEPKPKDEEKK